MTDSYEKAQRQSELSESPETSLLEAIDSKLKDLHTCLPGIIKSFNPTTQTAEVQPAIKRVFTERGAVNLPLCVDVPIVSPNGGGFYITLPVVEGDECLLVFSERCIDSWSIDGTISEPEDYRQHDLSDAFAILGITSQPNKLSSYNSSAMELRNKAGTVKLTISNSGFTFTGNVTFTGQVSANGHRIDETHKHSGVTTGGGQTGVVV